MAAAVPDLRIAREDAETLVTGATVRAQSVQRGDLFAGVPGMTTHGARFVGDAAGRGAVAVLTDPDGAALLAGPDGARLLPPQGLPVVVHEDPRHVLGPVAAVVYGDPSTRFTLVGITGTSGKTTTSYLVDAALGAAGNTTGLVGTVGTRIAGEVIATSLTTPEGSALQGLFAVMVERGVTAAVMEVSSHALDQNRAGGTRFAVGAFTNLSQDHLDYHPTIEDYFQAKSRLFVPVEPGDPVCAHAVICVDDDWGRRMADLRRAAGLPLSTVATNSPTDASAADWTTGDVVVAADGSQSFTLTGPGGTADVTIALPGRYNVANAALALAVAHAAGADLAAAAAGVALVAVPGRVQRIDRGQDFLAVVDYAHKPAAVEAVIATLRAQTPGRIGIVVGAGGDRDRGKRPLMGAAAARGAELVVVTDDNPRTEEPGAIRAAVLDGARAAVAAGEGRGGGEVREVGDRRAAIAAAVAWARPGDVVLIAGKGHEPGQEIAGVKHPFDDRDELARAIDARLRGSVDAGPDRA
ncbi:UDP-N-acetylmuramoyl-L-alanyl-D-glutamate--2,6-diaminopimelate ligase [Tsukamurella sp. 8F]|uniref:UDP-N-acetylmuramoyl-L-alanyl-D-glutamate--2, 6-diaminopimelate ligase n=1 Tax=unclassified Tsukamurella TaxID=2633480 RepID=UPI0023B8D6EA|nr:MULTISPECIES: UDP-N-acetylmuramoyl-L-alanyl-D-glutamate--2,6-diaminopimelate ligase [unclassified Tsukamurella]MDF0532458.1 UDP-N-acetylmuramoyl-L-alanyl-D-glutamate--2,6-diaminopimelate ligase [Tsukamurella sp. 8J]MDF0588441.1 UDP-N-acetylmuramoyl-L-alanyl-D-glutamate--2,6-diaminopimelate ligase [Tsukamurella sp. 8F]